MGQDPQVSMQLIEETRKQINRLFDEVARLSEMDLGPNDYYAEMLKRVLTALAAPAGAVWVKTAQGNLMLQYQIGMGKVGLTEENQPSHHALLRQAFQAARALHLPPHSSTGQPDDGGPAPGNPTDFILLLAPITVEKQVVGLIEVWQTTNRHPDAIQGFLQFLTRMAELASVFQRNHMLRQMGGQQQLWTQLEAFARMVHGSLNPVEVAYIVSNEGRRLIQCDRVSVGIRYGKKTRVEAISGADVVERRSNLVQLMRALFDAVLAWGERLVYKGEKDDSLPPDVLHALDEYLAESNSKLLVVAPLKEEREKDSKRPGRSAVMMECFETTSTPEQLMARMDVVTRHAVSSLYNAVEHRRIPFRWVWQPIAKLQEGLGGKARAIGLAVAVGLGLLVLAMIFVPYPLKMDAQGQVLPKTRRWIYSPLQAQVAEFSVQPGDTVDEGQQVIRMYDVRLAQQIIGLESEVKSANGMVELIKGRLGLQGISDSERANLQTDLLKNEATRNAKDSELQELIRRVNAEQGSHGYFLLRTPRFPPMSANEEVVAKPGSRPQWTVLNWDFREQMLNRTVQPSDPLIRVGVKEGEWEIELKIPQQHIGQVRAGFAHTSQDELDVDLLVRSDPTRTFKGKLHRNNIGGEARPHQTDQGEAEPVVLASVRISGSDIAPADRLPPELLETAGTEVKAKIRCGDHCLGYSLFYGVWEFVYEKVVFFF